MTDSAIDLLDSSTVPASLSDPPVAIAAEPDVDPVASTASGQSSGQATDPLTGAVAGGSYANTSNDNQVAVLSTIDYSTNYYVTNYLSVTYVQQSTVANTTNNSSLTTNSHNSLVPPPAVQPIVNSADASSSTALTRSGDSASGSSPQTATSSTSSGLPRDVSGAPVSSSSPSADSSLTPVPAPASSSALRQARELIFDSSRYFAVKGARRVDRILDFSVEAGDRLLLSRRRFWGLGALEFATASSVAERRALAATDVDVIYQPSTGRLFFNANGSDDGWGKRGGLFAVLEASPAIGREQFVVF